MKTLTLKKNSFGLRIYCTTCQRNMNYDKLAQCSHSDKQSYKSLVESNGRTRTKSHKTRDYREALALAIQFKKEVKSGSIDIIPMLDEVDPNSISLIDSANLFLNFKHGNTKYEHLKQNLSKDYLSSLVLYVKQFIEVMEKNGYNKNVLPVSAIGDEHISLWWTYIRKRYSSPASRNAALRVLRLWIAYMTDREKVVMRNPFKDVKLEAVEVKIEAITEDEFDKVCEAVTTKTPYKYLGGKTTNRKNMYRSFLVDSFKLFLQTGLRREELLTLKFDDIKRINNDDSYMIITDNLKVERITGKKYKRKYIPIHAELEKLLIELGWNEFKGTDLYIIEPFRQTKVKTMMDSCSKGFTHYYKQAFPDRPHKQLKVLRKTYLSYLERKVGEGVIHFSSHSGTEVLENHYFDQKIVAKGLSMKIFD